MRLVPSFVATLAVALFSTTASAAGDTVLVAGATGATGKQVVKTLVQQGYAVRALVRDPAKVSDLGEGVTIVQGDVTKPETLAPAAKGAKYVISAVGAKGKEAPNNQESVDYQGVVNLVDAAKAAGVEQFVLMSSIGAGNEDPDLPLNKMFGMVLKWKGKSEVHVRQAGVPYTIVRTGGLQVCEPGKKGLKLAPGDLDIRGMICRSDVARVMVDALGRPEAIGKTVVLINDAEGTSPDAWKSVWAELPKDEATR